MSDSSSTLILPQHPAPETLYDFVAGVLDDQQSVWVEAHLIDCTECVRVLDQHTPTDRLIERVQQSAVKQPVTEPTANATTTIAGYEILGELGRGGMGVVYRALDPRLKRQVALKVMLAREHATGAERERFRVEAETVAALRHPGIVQIYEVGEHEGRAFMALELVEGGDLRSWLKVEPRRIPQRVTMLLQLARSMQFAHQRGIVHRDLKPENILIVDTSNSLDAVNSDESWWYSGIVTSGGLALSVPAARITDFGLAKQIDSASDLTKSGVLMGTPNYMAPEQAAGNGRHVGPPADVHALGAILYEMLAYRPPFVGVDVYRTIAMVMNDDPIPLRELCRDVPRDLETICLKCLMKDPASRYESAQGLADDLELFLRGEPITARRLGTAHRLFRWARQKPTLASIFGGLIGFYALHLVAFLVLNVERNRLIHWPLTATFTWFGLTTWPIQRLLESPRWKDVGFYILMLQAVACATMLLALDRGPSSAPVPVFMIVILGSALTSFTPKLVWATTITSCIGYACLILFASWYRPNDQVPPDTAIGFELCLVLAGLLMHLILRRTQTMITQKSDTMVQ